ncbi:hypothetical protein [Alkalibacillus silvisoli]|uniref:asparagine synthase (glutamine-hydrolyzing) n=1 Tax=Alkalibacillus silvisoli TaxID=392823 RepID=A0ABN1A6X9_9BACI
MSDFFLSNELYDYNSLKYFSDEIFGDIYTNDTFFQGEWGTLFVTETKYYGFEPVEDEQYIMAVLGGPVLNFSTNEPKGSNHLTSLILDQWKSGQIKWGEDLSGPFVLVVVNKHTHEHFVYTDLMSFIPVYRCGGVNKQNYSSHVDLIALASGEREWLDYVSIADFVLNGIVTYPYTVYSNVFQVPPASEVKARNDKIITTNYWSPEEEKKNYEKKPAIQELDQALNNYVLNVLSRGGKVAQFISGGEDSRLLSSVLRNYNRDAYIFLDQMNREGNLAKKAAQNNNAKFNYYIRSTTHYLDIMENSSRLASTSAQYIHAHTYGFHTKCKLEGYESVWGGLCADALLKGSHITLIKGGGRPYIPQIKSKKENGVKTNLFSEQIINEINRRRESHLNQIRSLRPNSSEEWFELWPSSMNKNMANLAVNRRLFPSYEPFLANGVVKVSAKTPQSLKLNRRFFHSFSKPYLSTTKFLFHSDGRLPYLPWYINIPISLLVRMKNSMFKKLGIIRGVQGPWNDKSVLIQTEDFKEQLNKYSLDILEKEYNEVHNIFIELLNNNKLKEEQHFNLLQSLYLISFITGLKKEGET